MHGRGRAYGTPSHNAQDLIKRHMMPLDEGAYPTIICGKAHMVADRHAPNGQGFMPEHGVPETAHSAGDYYWIKLTAFNAQNTDIFMMIGRQVSYLPMKRDCSSSRMAMTSAGQLRARRILHARCDDDDDNQNRSGVLKRSSAVHNRVECFASFDARPAPCRPSSSYSNVSYPAICETNIRRSYVTNAENWRGALARMF